MSKQARSGAKQRLEAIPTEVTDMENAIERLALEKDRLPARRALEAETAAQAMNRGER